MEHLIYNYYIEKERKNIDLMILVLLHELRVMTVKQIWGFIQTDLDVPLKTIRNHVSSLEEDSLMIASFLSSKDSKTRVYYLTYLGYSSIQGYYPLPKVPEYNWYHSLSINDAMLQTIEIVKDQENLRYIQSERRQVYEIKDTEKNKHGRVFFVADYLLRFNGEDGQEINWYFEIELTIKTKKRYKKHVFVRYINYLLKHKEARLIYVSPSFIIQDELRKYRKEFEESIKDKETAKEIFSRFRILSWTNFQTGLKKLIAEDPHINW
ncbi:ArsR family transcriptional regulator [Enterococcus faecium]